MKQKVTIYEVSAMPNGGSIQVTVPKQARDKAGIKPYAELTVFQYEGPTLELGKFSIRSGDVVYRKSEPKKV